MESETEGAVGHWPTRQRTLSNMSQSSHSFNFPLMTSDSGLYTCSSMTSDSDTDSCHAKKDELQLALRDARRLRSELERLTKSEQWYKQELRHQKSTRLEDLERIYSQERKFMQDNQRLQKECVRLYDKCSELERELQKQHQESSSVVNNDTRVLEEDIPQFEIQQQTALINDQQQLISVLRKQKKALLDDLRNLTEEKDEKVMEMQRLLAGLEFDNKQITKKYTELSKERSQLTCNLKQKDSKLTLALDEKLNLQKSLVDIRDQLELQVKLVKLKEDEIAQLQIDFKDNMRKELDLDEVHRLSLRYHDEINSKSLEIITLKTHLSNMQDDLENMQELQAQNDQQQRLIEQLNFSLEASQLELQGIKESELLKSAQIQDLQLRILQDNGEQLEQQHDFANVCHELKNTNEQYTIVQERYKETQFKLELLEIDQSRLKFQNENDQQEIKQLRQKLREYLHQTSELADKIQRLEAELKKAVEENLLLKSEFENVQQTVLTPQVNKVENNNDSNAYNMDFLQLSQECEKLQSTLDAHGMVVSKEKSNVMQHLQSFANPSKVEVIDNNLGSSVNQENKDLSDQFQKLLENTNLLEYFLREKENIIMAINSAQHSNQGMQKLVTENEILRTKIYQIESEANSLQLKQDINDMTQKCTELEKLLDKQEQKEKKLQLLLLDNDSKLYKMERQLKILQDAEAPRGELHAENQLLRETLATEQHLKTELNAQLKRVKDQVEMMKETLESKKKPTAHKGVQCDIEKQDDIYHEVKYLKEQILDLQQKQGQYVEEESHKSEERLLILHKLSDLQNSKMQGLQDSQREWEDMLKSLKTVETMEEQTRRELELKRMELEELNQVFGEQNEELRKLEELTALIEFKRQHEKEQLKQTFQKEITVMKQQLMECRREIQEQEEINSNLQQKSDRMQQNYNDDYAVEIADYRREVRSLKNKVGRTISEKDEMLERIHDLENELKEIKHHQRQAVVLPELEPSATNETIIAEFNSNLLDMKSNIGEDHLRILTKVLEAEYKRKMQRYDEHIHSLLANVNSLKKSLKLNEEKTAVLSEEQSRTLDELKDLQKTKRNLEELRFKYEQSQNTIKELKQTLSLERKKFESCDLGKSQNEISTYEVANLIDDYKKLIQQSALVTKRPATSSILDLIQRSNQCVPNFQKLEANIGDLRCDLQNFVSSYTQKMPVTSLITAASLTVPPSLMDELRAASDGF